MITVTQSCWMHPVTRFIPPSQCIPPIGMACGNILAITLYVPIWLQLPHTSLTTLLSFLLAGIQDHDAEEQMED